MSKLGAVLVWMLVVVGKAWGAPAPVEVTFFTYPTRCQVLLLGKSEKDRLALGRSGYPYTVPSDVNLDPYLAGRKTARVLLLHDGFQDCILEDIPVSFFQPGSHHWPASHPPPAGAALSTTDWAALLEDCSQYQRLELNDDEVLLQKYRRQAWADEALLLLIYRFHMSASTIASLRESDFHADQRRLGQTEIDDDARAALQNYLQFHQEVKIDSLFFEEKPCTLAVRDSAIRAARAAGMIETEVGRQTASDHHSTGAADDRWARLRGAGPGPWFCSIARDGRPDRSLPASQQEIMAALQDPFDASGAVVQTLLRNRQKLEHFVKSMSAADITDRLRRRWDSALGVLRLKPLEHAFIVHTSPEGAQVALLDPSPNKVGTSGQSISLDFSKFTMDSGEYRPALQFTFTLPGFQMYAVNLPTGVVATSTAYPQTFMLTESVPGARLYYWAWRDHPLPTVAVLLVVVVAAWVGWGQLRALRHNVYLAKLREQDLAGTTDPMKGFLFGRYMVWERLGGGGMADVYKAFPIDRDYDKVRAENDYWAIKVVKPDLCKQEDFRERFLREVKLSTELDHPNVVRVKESGDQNSQLYLVMELVEGTTLETRIPSTGMLPYEALQYLRPIVAGVTYAHDRGILHRDLKPENIMVTSSGLVKIMDFGLARKHQVSQKITATGIVMGTPAYMPPEQIDPTMGVDARLDQYALGVMAFQMMSGRTPFMTDNAGSMLMHQLDDAPPSLRSLNPRVSAEVEAVVMRMLAKTPADRFPTLSEALAALETAVMAAHAS